MDSLPQVAAVAGSPCGWQGLAGPLLGSVPLAAASPPASLAPAPPSRVDPRVCRHCSPPALGKPQPHQMGLLGMGQAGKDQGGCRSFLDTVASLVPVRAAGQQLHALPAFLCPPAHRTETAREAHSRKDGFRPSLIPGRPSAQQGCQSLSRLSRAELGFAVLHTPAQGHPGPLATRPSRLQSKSVIAGCSCCEGRAGSAESTLHRGTTECNIGST